MIQSLQRRGRVYTARGAIVPHLFLAYRMWVWMELFVQLLALIIFYYFWQAVYASSEGTVGGLSLRETLNYILLAQILLTVAQHGQIGRFGRMLSQGGIAHELLRPMDFQGGIYMEELAELGMTLITKLPLLLIAWLFLGLQLPSEPGLWLAFAVSLLLGHAMLFCFDWIFACLAFYSTEIWGLGVLRYGVSTFFSGGLVPLVMMPEWLRTLTEAMPFAQALYVPVSFLSGITPLSEVPRIWLTQGVWLLGLWLLSRLIFNVAVRKITVQGG